MPLCANNKVSRAGLHTQPAKTIPPLFAHVPLPSPEKAQTAVRDAQKLVNQANERIGQATRSQLRDLLRSAQHDVDKARRTPGAKRELRKLESTFDKLKRDARRREGVIDDEQHQDRLMRTVANSASIDRLAPMNLGMGSARVMESPTPPAAPNVSEAVTSAITKAEGVLMRAGSATLQDLDAAKRASQKALARAKTSGAPAGDIARLQKAVGDLQRAENQARSQTAATPAPPMSDERVQRWVSDYLRVTSGGRDIVTVQEDGLTYIFDATAEMPDGTPENRVVAVHGKSGESHGPRDTARMAGYPNPRHLDRGHFLARSAGGGYDINLFPQDPRLNRGYSEEGHVWRELERYLADNPGTEFFVRPEYGDITDYPTRIEFGVQLADGDWRVESFDNRP